MRPDKRILSRIPQYALGLAVVALAGGCGTEPPVPGSIAIAPRSVTLTDMEPGAKTQLLATVRDQNGWTLEGVVVNWSSSDSSVATVVGDGSLGRVTVVDGGSTVVSASVGTLEATASVTIKIAHRWALLEFYRALGGDGWHSNTNWGSGQPLDRWFGVTTDAEGNVTRLRLVSNNLTGPIPPELVHLQSLWELSLPRNGLTGSIPPEFGNLTELGYLHLSYNRLAGPIPPELGNLTELEYLDLGYNELTGPIPSELGNLQKLGYLALRVNELTGAIPPELGNLQELGHLKLLGNELTGAIPPELGNLQELGHLSLLGNELTGAIPPELGNLQLLRYLSLGYNELTGPIPSELGNLQLLGYLSLRGNDLTGPVPPELANLKSISGLAIDNTTVSGRLPRELIGVPLKLFHWHDSDLCSPADEEFQEWLASIDDHSGNRKCSS